jgi:uncharacterized membrane protein
MGLERPGTLVEVAVRALSPGINDPHTAMSVLVRGDHAALAMPTIDYDGTTDAMFHMLRQNAADSPPVLIRLLEVLTVAAGVDRDPARTRELIRHADLVMADAER